VFSAVECGGGGGGGEKLDEGIPFAGADGRSAHATSCLWGSGVVGYGGRRGGVAEPHEGWDWDPPVVAGDTREGVLCFFVRFNPLAIFFVDLTAVGLWAVGCPAG